jgi:hypothetical protein
MTLLFISSTAFCAEFVTSSRFSLNDEHNQSVWRYQSGLVQLYRDQEEIGCLHSCIFSTSVQTLIVKNLFAGLQAKY